MKTNKNTLLALSALVSVIPTYAAQTNNELAKPNIVWYIIEDTSPEFLSIYNNGKGAKMKNIEQLKNDGVLFTNVYSNAPVSSAARTSLITGCYAPRIAGSFHRHIQKMPLPEGYNMFPSYLCKAGYYTSNANKTDYNVVTDSTAWDNIKSGNEGWRKRTNKQQPFFFMYSTNLTHESKLLFKEDTYKTKTLNTKLNNVNLAPYHPDTHLMRYTYATFYDQIAKADAEFGNMLKKLKADNVLDNTIIFFFGDNGGCLPGTKGYTNNVGLHVPLFVYIPPALQEQYNLPIGATDNRNISFVDFGATLLSIAGVKSPKHIDGVPFMGKYNNNKNKSVVCYGDRFDDLYSFNRVIYDGSFRYSRNYQPYHAQGMHAYYRYKSLAFQEWRNMYHNGELNKNQAAFFKPWGAEELYDVKNDPHELNNLANNPQYSKVLKSMRKQLENYVEKRHDLGFIPESVTITQGANNVVKFGDEQGKSIKKYMQIANLQLTTYANAKANLQKHIASTDDTEKWWALTTLSWFAPQAKEFTNAAHQLTSNKYPSYLRARALVYLSLIGEPLQEDTIIDVLSKSTSLAEVLLVQNDLTFIKESNKLPKMKFKKEQLPFSSESTKERIIYLNR